VQCESAKNYVNLFCAVEAEGIGFYNFFMTQFDYHFTFSSARVTLQKEFKSRPQLE